MSTVCVFGSSSEAIDRRYLDAAYSLGAAICRRGEGMIFGAGKYGIMGAAARGYISEGGVPTGVSPYFFRERNVLLEECNLVFTDSMRERKAYMEDNSDAFVICAGGIGTFEEFFEVLTLKQLGRHQKPIVIYNYKGYYTPMLQMMETAIRDRFMAEDTDTLYSVAETEEEVFAQLADYKAFDYNKYGRK